MQGPARRAEQRPRFPAWLDGVIVAGVIAAILGGYVLAAHALLIVPASDADAVLNDRDAQYFGLLGGALGVACVGGAIVGAVLRRSPFAIGMLFVALAFTGLVGIQVGTFHLACEGTNNIVRHWQCSD